MWYPHDIGFVRFQFIGSSPRQKKKKRKDPWPLLSGEKLFGPPFLPDPSWYRGKQCGTWQANGLMLPLRTLQGALSLCSLNGMFRGHTQSLLPSLPSYPSQEMPFQLLMHILLKQYFIFLLFNIAHQQEGFIAEVPLGATFRHSFCINSRIVLHRLLKEKKPYRLTRDPPIYIFIIFTLLQTVLYEAGAMATVP